jgi:hypothetical protein
MQCHAPTSGDPACDPSRAIRDPEALRALIAAHNRAGSSMAEVKVSATMAPTPGTVIKHPLSGFSPSA